MSLDPRAVEMVQSAHKRQLALRFEVSALTAAVAAGHTTTVGQQAYALSWLAEYAAGRVLDRPDAGLVLAEARARIEALPVTVPVPDPDTHPEAVRHTPRPASALACDVLAVFDELQEAEIQERLIGHKAEQQHGTAVPTKVADGKGGTPGRAPSPQTPQGAAGTTTSLEAGRWPDEHEARGPE